MRRLLLFLSLSMLFLNAHAQTSATGPVIADYGKVWTVPQPDIATDTQMVYRVVFDVYSSPDDSTALNPQLNTLARFINMHVRAGVPLSNLQVAGVVHNEAAKDLLDQQAYRARFGVDNPNLGLLAALQAAGADIYLCGQSAYSRGLDRNHLAEGVQVGLSAMTIILMLEEAGYRLIKF